MNYTSITDKPPIPARAPGKTIRLCADCIEHKYLNEPATISKATCKCEGCEEIETCREYEKARLVPVPAKKRVAKPIPVSVRFNIIKRQAVK